MEMAVEIKDQDHRPCLCLMAAAGAMAGDQVLQEVVVTEAARRHLVMLRGVRRHYNSKEAGIRDMMSILYLNGHRLDALRLRQRGGGGRHSLGMEYELVTDKDLC
jgi:hypothetical protein